jgi:hypothetical protein
MENAGSAKIPNNDIILSKALTMPENHDTLVTAIQLQ